MSTQCFDLYIMCFYTTVNSLKNVGTVVMNNCLSTSNKWKSEIRNWSVFAVHSRTLLVLHLLHKTASRWKLMALPRGSHFSDNCFPLNLSLCICCVHIEQTIMSFVGHIYLWKSDYRLYWFLIIDNHVKNKKYGNFVSISSLTGKCAAQKLKKNLCSSSLWTCLHHMVILIRQNKITDFLMNLDLGMAFQVT